MLEDDVIEHLELMVSGGWDEYPMDLDDLAELLRVYRLVKDSPAVANWTFKGQERRPIEQPAPTEMPARPQPVQYRNVALWEARVCMTTDGEPPAKDCVRLVADTRAKEGAE